MKTKITCLILALSLLVTSLLVLSGCSSAAKGQLQDGYYTAEASAYNHGWKEYVTIFVRDGKIITVEYNARNPSGFIKSWDMDYMRLMNGITGTYPNRYTRNYAAQLLEAQAPDGVDTMAGATNSHASFSLLAAAVIEHSINGDTSVAIVDIGE